jgi:hypothetical protein
MWKFAVLKVPQDWERCSTEAGQMFVNLKFHMQYNRLVAIVLKLAAGITSFGLCLAEYLFASSPHHPPTSFSAPDFIPRGFLLVPTI